MKMYKRMMRWTLALSLGASTVACDGEDAPADTDGGETDDGEGAQCDPVGQVPEMGMLLNAPLEADVETIQKTPTHPGAPGPTDLP